MSTHAKIRDEELHAFIDGELGGTARDRVEAAVDADAELGRQVAAFRADKARLVSLYGGGLNEVVVSGIIVGDAQLSLGGTSVDTYEKLKSRVALAVLPKLATLMR